MVYQQGQNIVLSRSDIAEMKDKALELRGTSRERENQKKKEFERILDEYGSRPLPDDPPFLW